MPIQESSLSIALQALANILASGIPEDVLVTVATPRQTYEYAETSDANILNIFPYKIAPSDLHASDSDEQFLFIRAYVLITAFASGRGDPEPDVELRVLGHAIRVLQSSFLPWKVDLSRWKE